MVLRPRLTTGLPFSQSTKGGAPTQRVVMTETSGAVKGGTKGRAPALGAAVASIHPVAEKEGVPGNWASAILHPRKLNRKLRKHAGRTETLPAL